VIALCILVPHTVSAAGKQGEFLQTDTIGMTMVTRDFTSHTTKTVADAAVLSEFMGLHLYVLDRWRMGMNLQLAEQLTPVPPAGESRFRSYAFLPQIGCNFYDPFFASLIYKIAPRTNGTSRLDMAVQALLGVGFPLSKRVRWSFSVEGPFAFYVHRTLGLVLLSGISIRL
jgi:hypothetical protein